VADIGRAITSRIRSANGIEGVDRPGLLEDVSSARRDLDRARDGRPNAQARLRAAIVRAARGGESQRDVAARAGCSQPYVSQVITTSEGRFVPSSGLGYVLAAHRADVLEIMGRFGVGNVKVFGTVARGQDGPDSDIDLLIDIPGEMGLFTLSRLELAVRQALGTSVDLVPSRMLEPDVRRDAERDAVPL